MIQGGEASGLLAVGSYPRDVELNLIFAGPRLKAMGWNPVRQYARACEV